MWLHADPLVYVWYVAYKVTLQTHSIEHNNCGYRFLTLSGVQPKDAPIPFVRRWDTRTGDGHQALLQVC